VDTLERLRGRLAERYQVERELGQGGMATVFLARDVRHQRAVAIKVLHPEIALSLGTERFEREILLAAQLQHPHILGLIDSGESDGLLYYVMPFVEGESLRDRLVREGPLPIDDAIQIALEVADALGYAHSHGVIHRDIKPENILLSGGHALVADFGIARAATEAGQKLTQTGMSLGTPTYMSPEQATGDPVGPTADLYSLGCVLFEMLAGEPPFSAKSAPALMARHALESVPSIRIVRDTVPEEVEDAIFASMAKVPADRPKDAAHFAEMLGIPLGSTSSRRASIRQTASRRVPTGAHRMTPLEAPWWRRPWMLTGAAVILAGVGVAAWLGNRGGSTAYLTAEDRARARRIAVLYFAHPSGEADLAPVADALTESLIRSLRDAKLEVISQNGVVRYRGADTPRDSIARALQIGTLIEGSVVPEGADRVRVTTWLTDADGNELGRRTNVLIPRDSLFAAEDAVSRQVSVRLREQLGLELRQAEDRARAGNAQAWTFYQRAQTTRKEGERAAVNDRAEGLQRLAIADSLLVAAAVRRSLLDRAAHRPRRSRPLTGTPRVRAHRSDALDRLGARVRRPGTGDRWNQRSRPRAPGRSPLREVSPDGPDRSDGPRRITEKCRSGPSERGHGRRDTRRGLRHTQLDPVREEGRARRAHHGAECLRSRCLSRQCR
jgi:serine/threonine-protein kinase